jgi:ArsR family transcriptional regulator
MTTDSFELQAQVFRALSHPVRLQILNVLARTEACVCHLNATLNRPQPYVSQQLATLRDARLVSDRRKGTLIYYRLADGRIAGWLERGRELVKDGDGNPISFPPAPPEVVPHCPCPHCQR